MDLYTDFPFADLPTQAGFLAEAEALGYAGVWATENKHDPFLPVAAAVRRERRISVGPAVVALLARNPFTVAQMAWDLHFNSGENFVLGIGTHQDVHLTARLGIPAEQKHARLADAVGAIREIWASWMEQRGPLYRGPYYSITACPEGYRPTTRVATLPKIYLLCVCEADLEIAPRVADGIFLHPTWVSAYLDRALDRPSLLDRIGKRPFPVIDGGIVATGVAAAEFDASRTQARNRIASYWVKREYDDVYAALGVLERVERFRSDVTAGRDVWRQGDIEDLYHLFVCDAPFGQLGATIAARSHRLVTGVFPNIVSDLPRLMPAEVIADIRRSAPRQAA